MTTSKSPATTPTASRVLDDGTIIEMLYDHDALTTSLAVAAPSGDVSILGHIDLPNGERLVPYSPHNNLLTTGCVLLPSSVGETLDTASLVAEIRAYLDRYVDLSPAFTDLAPHYVLLTWVYDAFNDVPYLRFRGDYGTGKTRALLTLGSISYKPFFASAASTVSPIFHVLDAFGGTLVLDEADLRFSDATADLTKILNNGNMRGIPVLRTMTNRHNELNPRAFQVFGPKIVAMRERFDDRALESRFLTEDTGKQRLRDTIPLHQPDSLATDALRLRNLLLAWRFSSLQTIGPKPERMIAGLEPRRNQMALPLLSLIDDEVTRERLQHELVGEEARVFSERAATPEATLLACLRESFSQPATFVTVAELTRTFNAHMAAELGALMTPKWVGSILRTKLRLTTIKTRGVYVVPCTERGKIEILAARYGLIPRQSPPETAQ